MLERLIVASEVSTKINFIIANGTNINLIINRGEELVHLDLQVVMVTMVRQVVMEYPVLLDHPDPLGLKA